MKKLPPIGLKPIKQLDLYTKWRKIVPQEYKDITSPLPPEDIIKQFRTKIMEQLEVKDRSRNVRKDNVVELDDSNDDDNLLVEEDANTGNDRNRDDDTVNCPTSCGRKSGRKSTQPKQPKRKRVALARKTKKNTKIIELSDNSEDELWSLYNDKDFSAQPPASTNIVSKIVQK